MFRYLYWKISKKYQVRKTHFFAVYIIMPFFPIRIRSIFFVIAVIHFLCLFSKECSGSLSFSRPWKKAENSQWSEFKVVDRLVGDEVFASLLTKVSNESWPRVWRFLYGSGWWGGSLWLLLTKSEMLLTGISVSRSVTSNHRRLLARWMDPLFRAKMGERDRTTTA